MKEIVLLFAVFIITGVFSAGAQEKFEEDTFTTSAGKLKITLKGSEKNSFLCVPLALLSGLCCQVLKIFLKTMERTELFN